MGHYPEIDHHLDTVRAVRAFAQTKGDMSANDFEVFNEHLSLDTEETHAHGWAVRTGAPATQDGAADTF